ncbi:MAG: hypothetical protein EA426_12180 [Spirochaetaceae bacterium]|nr:MAG: hypothetical protein EA426_12180 [Spirochaetaceae bacterium]
MNTTRFSTNRVVTTLTVLLFGAIWGFAEATVGHALHLLPRLIAVPPLAGFVMFPIGVVFMLAAVHATRRPATAFFVALVAATVKFSSVVLPSVSWVFVQNPVVAIVLQGLTVWGLVTVLGFGANRAKAVVAALSAGVVWRLAFAALSVSLGVRWGLLTRGTSAVVQFVVFDSLVNAVIIVVLLHARLHLRAADAMRRFIGPTSVGAACALAVIAEIGLRLI